MMMLPVLASAGGRAVGGVFTEYGMGWGNDLLSAT